MDSQTLWKMFGWNCHDNWERFGFLRLDGAGGFKPPKNTLHNHPKASLKINLLRGENGWRNPSTFRAYSKPPTGGKLGWKVRACPQLRVPQSSDLKSLQRQSSASSLGAHSNPVRTAQRDIYTMPNCSPSPWTVDLPQKISVVPHSGVHDWIKNNPGILQRYVVTFSILQATLPPLAPLAVWNWNYHPRGSKLQVFRCAKSLEAAYIRLAADCHRDAASMSIFLDNIDLSVGKGVWHGHI